MTYLLWVPTLPPAAWATPVGANGARATVAPGTPTGSDVVATPLAIARPATRERQSPVSPERGRKKTAGDGPSYEPTDGPTRPTAPPGVFTRPPLWTPSRPGRRPDAPTRGCGAEAAVAPGAPRPRTTP